jgi:hypothetical protein
VRVERVLLLWILPIGSAAGCGFALCLSVRCRRLASVAGCGFALCLSVRIAGTQCRRLGEVGGGRDGAMARASALRWRCVEKKAFLSLGKRCKRTGRAPNRRRALLRAQPSGGKPAPSGRDCVAKGKARVKPEREGGRAFNNRTAAPATAVVGRRGHSKRRGERCGAGSKGRFTLR